ncbi:nucleotide exchange factor GrpE [Nocardia sp. NPDC050406]|uniref:nucleotide exchange factor GrpE n=1 Tax=Nocardia sp. NPDC050406 TaxID=3364318 RepID=UPI00379EDC02
MTESAAAAGHSDGVASPDAVETEGRTAATESAAPPLSTHATPTPSTPHAPPPNTPHVSTPRPQEAPSAPDLTALLAERVEDLARVIARQANTIERLADEAKARAQRERAGADVPLVVELFGLHGDVRSFAATAQSESERAAFEAFAARVERLLTGRGGRVVEPAPGTAFDALTMEAADVRATDDPEADRTVDSVVTPGLLIGERSVRPAKVVVRRHRAPKPKPAAQS